MSVNCVLNLNFDHFWPQLKHFLRVKTEIYKTKMNFMIRFGVKTNRAGVVFSSCEISSC